MRATLGTIDPATTSGTQLATLLNNRTLAENTQHSDVSGRPSYAQAGMLYTIITGGVTTLMLAGAASDGSQDINLSQVFADRPGRLAVTAEVRLPAGWLWADGAAVSRTTYAALFDAICPAFTGTIASGAGTITAVSENFTLLGGKAGLVGARVECATPGVLGATAAVTDVAATTITVAPVSSAAVTGGSFRIFPHGNGNASSTFNVPNCKGRIMIGRQDMGAGGSSGLITTAGSGIDGTVIGAVGGAQNVALTPAMIPAHNHPASSSGTVTIAADGNHTHTFHTSVTVPAHNHAPGGAGGNFFRGNAGALNWMVPAGNTVGVVGFTDTAGPWVLDYDGTTAAPSPATHTHSGSTITVTTTVNNSSASTANVNNVQPSIVENVVVKT